MEPISERDEDHPPVVYMKDYPEVPVQCCLVEVPERFYHEELVRHNLERRFGKVNYVHLRKDRIQRTDSEGMRLGSCYVMFANAEIAALAMNQLNWHPHEEQLNISEAKLCRQLEPQPAEIEPPPFKVHRGKQISPFNRLNAYCLMPLLDLLPFDALCNLSAADSGIHQFADDYIFSRVPKHRNFYTGTYEAPRIPAKAHLNCLRRDLHFIGAYLESVTLCGNEFIDGGVNHIISVIEACPNLLGLRLNKFEFTMYDVVRLSRVKCPAKSLTLFRCRIQHKQWATVLVNWPQLAFLVVHNIVNDEDCGIGYLLEPCRNLQLLHIFSSRCLTKPDLNALLERSARTLGSLKLVEVEAANEANVNKIARLLRYPELQFVGVEVKHLRFPFELQQLKKFKRLKGMHIRSLPMLKTAPFIAELKELRLDRLEVDYFQMNGDVAKALGKLSTVSYLKLSTVFEMTVENCIQIVNTMANLTEFEVVTIHNQELGQELERALQRCDIKRTVNLRCTPAANLV